MNLTENFTLEEMIKNGHGFENKPDDTQIKALKNLCEKVLQPLRDGLKMTIIVQSGFRCYALNKKVGGSATSQHMKGEAADINCFDKATAFFYIAQNLDFDQLIWEKGTDIQPQWIHVSCKLTGKNRRQKLRYDGVSYKVF